MKLKNKVLIASISVVFFATALGVAYAAEKAKRSMQNGNKRFSVRVKAFALTDSDNSKLEKAIGNKISTLLKDKLGATVNVVTTDTERQSTAGVFEALGLKEDPKTTVLLAEMTVLPNFYEIELEIKLSQVALLPHSDPFSPQHETLWRVSDTAKVVPEDANKTIDQLIESAVDRYVTTSGKKADR